MNVRWHLISMILLANYVYAEGVEQGVEIGSVTVTARPSDKPLLLKINPKAPFQPIPPSDGAGLLKTVPNMSVIRKGGVSGDPLFRGLGGSRLAITANDSYVFGGCGGRMDPPTAYIFPDAYDEVRITKGPQTVTQGPGVVSGSVQFIRRPYYFEKAGLQGNIALTGGNFGRMDLFADITGGLPWGYAHFNVAHNRSNDYQDGANNAYHSAYKRDSRAITLGLTPDKNTVIEASYDYSRGWAEYADRMMDGVKFDRDAWKIRAERKNITSWLSSLKMEYGHSYIDHVMDNYTRRPAGKMSMAKNPDRTTDTLRLQGQLEWETVSSKIGFDYMNDEHSFRSGKGKSGLLASQNYHSAQRVWDQKFRNVGIFAETTWQINEQNKLITGLRHDINKAQYNQKKGIAPNDLNKKYRLTSGFMRYEYHQPGLTYFAGLGLAQRAPDFWERLRTDGERLKAETNLQLDAGLLYRQDKLKASVNVFASRINDFILIDGKKARNIRANRLGLEGDVSYQFMPHWKAGLTMAYTYGQNKTDSRPLAQTPPLESKTYLSYDNGTQSITALMRHVAAQHRYAVGQGNIIGQDVAYSPAFFVFSVNGGWKFNKNIHLTAGVDNIFDKKYREFTNKSASSVAGYNPSNGLQIYEPGRQFWARLQVKF